MNKNLYILLFILLVLFIIYNLQKNEHYTTLTPQSNEALLNVASVYNTKQMTLDNLHVTNTLQSDNTNSNTLNVTTGTNLNKLDVSGNTQLNTLNVSDISTLTNLNVSKNINTNTLRANGNTTNNLGMITFNLSFETNGVVTDPSGNTYNAKDWTLFITGVSSCGGNGFIQLGVNSQNLWYVVPMAAGCDTNYPYNYQGTILAIPKGMFSIAWDSQMNQPGTALTSTNPSINTSNKLGIYMPTYN